ncbi:MAG: NUDIX domain-containing protein [Candidatus Marinimicrobia bacterium]|nr:NUDIX domain-containing protein [Candidatus Neomarinimicrobiota bacterium]MCF7839348.1 NUDIX domain-containing protein [Candidatus Neomarinimicrobiota bacterium]
MVDDYIHGLVDVFVWREGQSGREFLLLKRAPEEQFPNIWQCVSGGVKPGEKAWQTALRELQEETGYRPKQLFVADYAYNLYLHPIDSMLQVPVFGAEIDDSQDPAPRLSKEHTTFQWYPLEEALSVLAWENYRLGIQAVNRMVNSPALLEITRIPRERR